jgi:hypothetical protein
MTMDTLLKDAPARPRRTLTSTPKMTAAAQRLGLVEAPPPDPKGMGVTPIPSPPPPPTNETPQSDTAPGQVVDPEEKAARQAAVRQVEALLRERWPVAFCVPRPPLAVGIHKQVLELASDAIDPVALGRFMHWWVRRTDYLDAVAHGEARRNLDGSAAGEPDERQRREAARQVYGARAEAVLAWIAARRVPAPVAADSA